NCRSSALARHFYISTAKIARDAGCCSTVNGPRAARCGAISLQKRPDTTGICYENVIPTEMSDCGNPYGQACNQSVSVSVALLLARFGSVTPLGGVTFAVSEREPVAEAL